MYAMTISSKFQIAIPRQIRELLSLSAGQKLEAVCLGGHLELVPIKPMKEMRGFLKGMDSQLEREEDRDL
jgi:AbrB family looped-hinge helix DNA binding protein